MFGDSGDELLVRDELELMELKELGGVCQDFDLTPQDYIVKVRGKTDADATKAAVIDAILEAQGAADEDTEEGADPEDPF